MKAPKAPMARLDRLLAQRADVAVGAGGDEHGRPADVEDGVGT